MQWPAFQYDQTNLVLLCQDWPVDAAEYHAQNSLYGFNWLLKQYAELATEEPLPWAMEHAISFDNPEPYFAEAESCLPIILALTDEQSQILRDRVEARVESIGSAFFYMEKAFRERHPGVLESEVERRGTLVFPDKSTRNQDTDYDRAAFARELAELPEEYQPVAVSVFWRDYERGTHQPFLDAGLMVVTSGNPYDPEFLFRQLDMCRQFKYSCANDLSTSFCLSILGGCQFFYWPTGPLTVTRDGKTEAFEEEPTLHLPAKKRCIEASPFPPVDNWKEQRELAALFAGESSVRPPEFFRELAAEGQRLLRALTPESVSLGLVQSLDHLAQWQPRAIDNDGWAQERSGFVIPFREGVAGVRLRIDVPMRERQGWDGEWSLTIDGVDTYFFTVIPGTIDLEIPIGSHQDRRTIFITSGDPIPLLNEARRRCFRVTDIEWIEALSDLPFSWGYRIDSEGNRKPTGSPELIRFAEEPVSAAKRVAWLLTGIDGRGWVRQGMSFTVWPREKAKGVRLKIRPREGEIDEMMGRVVVSASDGPAIVSEISRGGWYLEVPVPNNGRPVQVSLKWDSPQQSEASEDHPNFRVQRLEWRSKVVVDSGTGKRDWRRLRQLDELKQLAAQPPRRPWWKRLVRRA